MTSYLIYTKDEEPKSREVALDADVTNTMRMPEEQSNADSIFLGRGGASEHTSAVNTSAENILIQPKKYLELSPLMRASSSAAEASASSRSSVGEDRAGSRDVESSSSFITSSAGECDAFNDEGLCHGQTNDGRRMKRRYYPKRKNSSYSSEDSTSPSYGNISIKMNVYCVVLIGGFLYALRMLTGRLVSETPLSSIHPTDGASSLQTGSLSNSKFSHKSSDAPRITVGAYYYPWHGGDFHKGDGYVRKILQQGPLLGEYDDRDPKVIQQHLEWSRRGNINLWVTSWWGPYKRDDNTTRTVILDHPQLQPGEAFEDHKIALFYETFGRIRKGDNYSLHRIQPDMEFICEHYLNHPSYYTLEDGRPVLFMYLTRALYSLVRFESAILLIRKSIKDTCGKDVYIVGDQIFGSFDKSDAEPSEEDALYSSTPSAFDLLDGVTNYDVYGSLSEYVGTAGGYISGDSVSRYYLTEQRKWRQYAKEKKGCSFIPSVAPGYNDLGVRPQEGHIPLARSLRQEDGNGESHGSLFRVSVRHARTLVDPSASYLLMVNSFNEWHEDTQIEPAIGKSTSMPNNITYGMEYHGYGTLYLDILRNATKDVKIVV